MRVDVYVDGFNLYYRLLKNRPETKWLDLEALAKIPLPSPHEIQRVMYYTARVSARVKNPGTPVRQAAYLNALGTVPTIEAHFGNFQVSKVPMPLARPLGSFPKEHVVKVIKTEEKGSDVNLGCHLVRDAFKDAFDVAAVVSDDTDLVEPIRIVVEEIGKRVVLLTPKRHPARSLKANVSSVLRIEPHHLLEAQFPDEIECPDGRTLKRPVEWNRDDS